MSLLKTDYLREVHAVCDHGQEVAHGTVDCGPSVGPRRGGPHDHVGGPHLGSYEEVGGAGEPGDGLINSLISLSNSVYLSIRRLIHGIYIFSCCSDT